MKDSLIILSGGMDSVTLLYEKIERISLAITFDYGSSHNKMEIGFASYHCERLRVEHIVIPLRFIHDYFKSSPIGGGRWLFLMGGTRSGIWYRPLWHFRNGIMLSIGVRYLPRAEDWEESL